jgi:hypothetical protein
MQENNDIALQKEETPEPIIDSYADTFASEAPPKQQPIMETHAHHLHKAPGKKGWHYFFEFFMLFLAVFCGFLAENIREDQVEKERANVYMKNMLDDLRSDTITYGKYIRDTREFLTKIDSMLILMGSPERDAHISRIYYLARTATMKASTLYPNDRTFDQMKYSGYLRLIRNQDIADSASLYYNAFKGVSIQNEIIMGRITTYMQNMGKVFDARVMMQILKDGKEPAAGIVHLITNDRNAINEMMTNAQYFYGARLLQMNWSHERNARALNLMALIEKEYKFNKQRSGLK